MQLFSSEAFKLKSPKGSFPGPVYHLQQQKQRSDPAKRRAPMRWRQSPGVGTPTDKQPGNHPGAWREQPHSKRVGLQTQNYGLCKHRFEYLPHSQTTSVQAMFDSLMVQRP